MNGSDPQRENTSVDPGAFDADWYLARYPDVALLGMDALEHYRWIGARLGRKTNAKAGEISRTSDPSTKIATNVPSKTVRNPSSKAPAEFGGKGGRDAHAAGTVSAGIHAHKLDAYFGRSLGEVNAKIANPAVKVVAFDIFDTLLVRPFLDADYVRTLLDDEYRNADFAGFRSARAAHEDAARRAKGQDVDIHEIYDALLAAVGHGDLIRKEREIELEIATVDPRAEVVDLFNLARRSGKRVVLASDTVLPRDVIETMLRKCGIDGWDHLYLSRDVGVRKDATDLCRHMIASENVSPNEMLIIGDDARFDHKVPSDTGLRTIHILKPVDVLRAMPRFADLVPDAHHAGPGEQFVFGAIATERFSRISFSDFSVDDMFGSVTDIGYGLLGPIIVGFCQWLDRQVDEEGLTGLYFLAQEGQFLKRAYDRWQTGRPDPIRTESLLVSRRAVTMPCIASLDDALDFARADDFYGETMESFLIERFGVALPDTVWSDVARRGLGARDEPVRIMAGEIDHLEPFFEAVLPYILRQAASERAAAQRYLEDAGLGESGGAVIDVGYAGTIQRHLVTLLKRDVAGLYLRIDEGDHAWGMGSGVTIKGCYGEGARRSPEATLMVLDSFLIGKMLNAQDHQVMRYTNNGEIEFRGIADQNDKGAEARTAIQGAAMRFVADAVQAQREIFGKMDIPVELCERLYSRFVSNLSRREKSILSDLEPDGFYGGRGTVS